MALPSLDSPLTGTAVPLSSLRSRGGTGIGEYPDLEALGAWCDQAGLRLVQLLPVNDTGFEPSPYSALSATALHPVYLRLAQVPGYDAVAAEAQSLAARLNALPAVDHRAVWAAKLDLLRRMFARAPLGEAQAEAWLSGRAWGRPYAVFWALRERYGRAGWQAWPEHRRPDAALVARLWTELGPEARFPVWLQMQAEAQFAAASRALEAAGVALKGDLPILLNEDSADVWYHPEYFDLGSRAGAPPDGENPDGQNWGFPVYRWERLAQDGYGWWKDRLLQASRFYQAFRIDHVLGFFRLWSTPQQNLSAQMGHYQPAAVLSPADLAALGYDEGRLTWMTRAHVFGRELREHLGPEAAAAVQAALEQIGQEDLYRFRTDVTGERDLQALALSESVRSTLIRWFRNRMLLAVDGGYVATAQYYASRAYLSLNNDERWAFEQRWQEAGEQAARAWEAQGHRLLGVLKATTPMLVCAEDLGSIPDAVPRVLNSLGILGLKILRWARDWNAPGQPYLPVASYPELSVCTPSVHDTSTLRQWWAEEPDHRGVLGALGLDPSRDDGPWTPAQAAKVLAGLLRARSRLCVVALQDWFNLEPSFLTADPADERVNVPGTVGGANWAWRMKPDLEDLRAHTAFTAQIRGLTDRRSRP